MESHVVMCGGEPLTEATPEEDFVNHDENVRTDGLWRVDVEETRGRGAESKIGGLVVISCGRRCGGSWARVRACCGEEGWQCMGNVAHAAKNYTPRSGPLHHQHLSPTQRTRRLVTATATSLLRRPPLVLAMADVGRKRTLEGDAPALMRKKLRPSELPLSQAKRSAIDSLVHTFRKKGQYDSIRKELMAQYVASVCKTYFDGCISWLISLSL